MKILESKQLVEILPQATSTYQRQKKKIYKEWGKARKKAFVLWAPRKRSAYGAHFEVKSCANVEKKKENEKRKTEEKDTQTSPEYISD